MATFPTPSDAVRDALNRRASGGADVRIEWYIKNVSDKVELTMQQRTKLATELVRSKVVKNISRPVTVGTSSGGRRVVKDRSKPGEFPKADTTALMKSIFGEVRKEPEGWTGYVGTPLDYGLFLEVSPRLNRSFLLRTLRECQPLIKRIFEGPMKT